MELEVRFWTWAESIVKNKTKTKPAKMQIALFLWIYLQKIEFQKNILIVQSGRMQGYKTMKRNKISRRSKSTEWESMKAVPKVGNVQGIDLPEAAIGSILKNFAKFTGKHLARDFFNEVFFKKKTLAQVFSRESCETFDKSFLQNISGRLLLFTKIWQSPFKISHSII